MSVLLKNIHFDGVTAQELAQQLEAKKKCKEKLPTYYETPNIIYPEKLNLEQTSSEITARYKATLVSGKRLVDLTGGLGVDSYFFSKKIALVYHCEIDPDLSEIAAHNFEVMGAKNIQTICGNGLEFLAHLPDPPDWVFVDPSRRNEVKKKVFLLSDCLPNLPAHLPSIFEKTTQVLVKTAPLLDLSMGLKELLFVKEIHIVGVGGEVKELLWILEKAFVGEVRVKTVNFMPSEMVRFDFVLAEEKNAIAVLSPPLSFLYEPNAAILKSGAFKTLGNRFSVYKLHEHTHLYTSEEVLSFPGRVFKIDRVLPYNKKNMRQYSLVKANISIRNFPESVASLRSKFKIKDGGELYLFFIKNNKEEYVVLQCSKPEV